MSSAQQRLADGAVAGGLLALGVGEALSGSYQHRVALAVTAVGIAGVSLLRRRWPLSATIGLVAVLAATSATGATTNTVTVVVTYVLWAWSLGAFARRWPAGVGLALLVVSSFAAILLDRQDAGAGDLVFVAVLLLGGLGLGRTLRRRDATQGELVERVEAAEGERDRRALEAVRLERTRIARELHDVVAHSVSVMVMQTGVVRRRLAGHDPPNADLLEEVESVGRDAVDELRRLLGLLRADEDGLSLAPQPGLAGVDRLVGQLREAGLDVETKHVGMPVTMPAGLELAAFRIVQEALTNALKHGDGSPARLTVRHRPGALELQVRNRGSRTTHAPGTGHGLVGIRERVALYGGSLEAGPTADGEFRVRAVLPVRAAQ